MMISFSRESIILVGLCAVDAVLTAIFVALGLAWEANPIMAFWLERGYFVFCFIKLGGALLTVSLAEMYRKQNPQFVRTALRTAVTAYIVIYFAALAVVNAV